MFTGIISHEEDAMKQLVQKAVVATVTVAVVGAALMWSGQSLPSSHASSGVQSQATTVALPVAPGANGFTEVAKAVTPAVVNITTVLGEKVSDGRKIPDELRDRMEEFFGGPQGPGGPRGFQIGRAHV